MIETSVVFELLDVNILLHIVVPKIDVVHSVFSDSALGDDTSTYTKKGVFLIQ